MLERRGSIAPLLPAGIYKVTLQSIPREGIERVQARVESGDSSTCPSNGNDSLATLEFEKRTRSMPDPLRQPLAL